MKRKKLNFESDFTKLLSKLDEGVKNVCLLAGSKGGWRQRIAWDPCDSYVLPPSEIPNSSLNDFITYHGSKQHLIVGFINYNLGQLLHGINPKARGSFELPSMVIFAFENYLEKKGNEVFAFYEDAGFIDSVNGLDKIKVASKNPLPMPNFKESWNRQSYHEAFEKVKGCIYDGLVYQLNLTHRLDAVYKGSSRDLFPVLASRDAGKMSAYVEGPGFDLISMSPERFIRTDDKLIETAPIKGTRRRGKNKSEDARNYRELINDDKEKAELNMITDLLRNDLGKVCAPGSVKLEKHREIEKMRGVMHTFSLIRGLLRDDISPLGALLSMFPGGSITGCPKKKAMEIIDELEDTARDAYCGSIFTLDRKSNLDSSILIRTITRKSDRLAFPVGGGIVYDSDERREYQESLDKADSLIRN
jgi:anthranilate/para-aminobenzoate synthase component I